MSGLSFFFKQGSSIEVHPHQRIFLHETTSLLYMEKGDADIFVIDMNEGQDIGLANKLAEQMQPFDTALFEGSIGFFRTVRSGDILFSFPLDENLKYFIVLAPQKNTILRKISIEEIRKELKTSEFKFEFNSLLSNWLNQFASLFSSYSIEYPDQQGSAKGILQMNPNQTIMLATWAFAEIKSNFVWMHIINGELLLFDIEALNLVKSESLFPTIKGMWFKSKSAAEVSFIEPENVSYEDPFWKGIKLFHRKCLKLFAIHQRQILAKEISKSKLKIEREKKDYITALNELQSVLSHEELMLGVDQQDLLFNTCQLAARQLNLKFSALTIPEQRTGSLDERVHRLCFYSGIYYRKVFLTENWWKHDVGPLVGFYGEEERPVALIPQKGVYQLVDLKEQAAYKVDLQIDKNLSSNAYKFYRSLPDKKAISKSDLFHFSLANNFKSLVNILLLGALAGFLNLFFPFFNYVIFDFIIPNGDRSLLLQVIVGLILISICTHIFLLGREYTLVRLEGLLEQDLEASLWQRLFNLRLQFFRRYEIGDLLLRVLSIKHIREVISGRMLRIILNSFFATVYLFSMFYYSFPLALAGLITIFIGITITFWAIFKNITSNSGVQQLKGQANGLVLQLLAAISKIRVAGSEAFSFITWEKLFFPAKRLEWKSEKISVLVKVINFAFSSVSILVIYTVALYMMKGSLQVFTIGSFLAFLAAFSPFLLAMTDLNTMIFELSRIIPTWRRSSVIFNEPPEIDFSKIYPGTLSGDLKIDHVFFRYDKKGPFILEDVSLEAKPGEMIGIVGHSGCGKSSLARLMIGLETPESGAIYYDGKDLATLNIKLVRKQLGIILDSSTILDGSIRDNIILEGFYSDEEVKNALTLSGFEEDLKRLPMGLNTILMDGGNTLSGGQKQRLLIARALIGKPRLLIMDEATSALDNKTQDLVSKNLDRMNVTRIVIAHRLSTIRHADRIYVIEKGKIADAGTFTELASRPGVFADLLEKQRLAGSDR